MTSLYTDYLVEVLDNYINGNISDAKKQVKKMTKAEFIDLIEHARANGIMPYKLRVLTD